MSFTREQFDKVMMPNYAPAALIPEKGEGVKLWDKEGNEYIDLGGGIAVNSLGHCHPALVETLTAQANKLWHMSNIYTNEPALELATNLVENTFAEKVFFANSGAEANEAALKLARRYAADNYHTEKREIIAFYNSFHGRTLFTVSVGGQAKYTEGFEPLPGGITHVEFNNLQALEQTISDDTCAVIMEPILGEGGIVPATKEFVKGVRALCDKHNALLIFDEVQTGVGRTGHLYAYQGFDVTPDILTTAKSLGGGFPVGATLATAEVAKSLVPGTHGSTYGGNPLACAVANTVLNTVNKPELLASIPAKFERFKNALMTIGEKYGVFSEVRGQGLLIGAGLTEAWQGKAKEFVNAGVEHGVLVLVAGLNTVRIAPSLLITDAEIDEAMARFEKAVVQVAG